MTKREDIIKIIEAGSKAPSGGNSQPWQFEVVNDKTLNIVALPEKDHPILNFRFRGTWVAHGALLENILVASSFFGYKADYQIFPDPSRPNLTVRINFEAMSPNDEPLYQAVDLRVTNRKRYQSTPLTPEQKRIILDLAKEAGAGEVKLIENKEEMVQVAQAASMNEVVMLENKTLHNLFFREVVWTELEEQRRGGGLYLKTLELKPPQQLIFKLLRHWRVASLFNKIGFAKIIAKGNASIYASGAAMGVIIVEDNDEDFIKAGQLLEKVWLNATQMGLSLQLMTGVLFFNQKISASETAGFSTSQVSMIKNAYKKIVKVFDVRQGVVALLFRVGVGEDPSARSLKSSPPISFKQI